MEGDCTHYLHDLPCKNDLVSVLLELERVHDLENCGVRRVVVQCHAEILLLVFRLNRVAR